MNICKIDILNFRGIKNASILVSENAVFVSDNNSRKSTLFEAIDLVMERILSRIILPLSQFHVRNPVLFRSIIHLLH